MDISEGFKDSLSKGKKKGGRKTEEKHRNREKSLEYGVESQVPGSERDGGEGDGPLGCYYPHRSMLRVSRHTRWILNLLTAFFRMILDYGIMVD